MCRVHGVHPQQVTADQLHTGVACCQLASSLLERLNLFNNFQNCPLPIWNARGTEQQTTTHSGCDNKTEFRVHRDCVPSKPSGGAPCTRQQRCPALGGPSWVDAQTNVQPQEFLVKYVFFLSLSLFQCFIYLLILETGREGERERNVNV